MEQDYKPKVSIIIPVFNGSNYMKEAIDSALAQTYTNIEVIVINDGSNDNGATDNIALIYGDRIRYFSKENGGVASALNLGIKNMTGEYFSWLSHDDSYFPEKIQIQVEIVQKTKSEDAILYGGYELIDEHLNVIAKVRPDALYPEEKLNIPLLPILRGLINGCCLLIHKSHFERVGVFDEKLKTTQDYALWFKMFRHAKLIYHKEILVKSRFHQEQSSKKIPDHISECNQLWISFLDQVTPEEMCEIDGLQYLFYKRTAEFLQNNTPYTLAQQHATAHAEMAMERISVIIPFFNRSKLLLSAVNSVLDQTYGKFEVLLIDDGSTEDLKIIKDIMKRDSRVRYIYQEHKGAAAARNLGISLAKGSYIAFLDSDDIFAPQKLEKQILFMQTKGFHFSHTSYQRMDNDGNLMGVIDSGSFSGELFPRIIGGCSIASPTVMIKKEILESLRFKEDLEIGEDICLWIDIAYCYPIGGMQEPLTNVRFDSFSAASNVRKQQIGLMNIADHVIKNSLYAVHKYYVYLLLEKLLYLFSDNHS
ncbi:MAG: glycosyltransferase [Desulfosporosinus sp.]|nr:glycosyltransferase [Desulfosporosinus sp.]